MLSSGLDLAFAMNSKQLWLLAQDLNKSKPVKNFSTDRAGNLKAPHSAKKVLAVGAA